MHHPRGCHLSRRLRFLLLTADPLLSTHVLHSAARCWLTCRAGLWLGLPLLLCTHVLRVAGFCHTCRAALQLLLLTGSCLQLLLLLLLGQQLLQPL